METQQRRFPYSEKRGVRTLTLACVIACCMLSISCSHEIGAWVYRADSYPPTAQPALNKTVVVVPFKDSRPKESKTKFFDAQMLIPLIPYAWSDNSRPESPEAKKLYDLLWGYPIPWQFRPDQDFTEAAEEELNASGLFKKVVWSDRDFDGDLIFRGELKSTRYLAKAYTYGLGIFQFIPAMFGAPIGSVMNELDVEFVLEEGATGVSLWHKSYHETKEATFYLYWHPPDFYYDKLFKSIMRDVVKSLQTELPVMFPRATDDSPTSSRRSSSN